MGDNTRRGLTSGGDTIRDIAVTSEAGNVVKSQDMLIVRGLQRGAVGNAPGARGSGVPYDVSARRAHAALLEWRDNAKALYEALRANGRGPPTVIPNTSYVFALPAIGFTTPVARTDLLAWHDTDTGVTVASGHISGWSDQGSSGDANRALTQATAGARPAVFVADPHFNGKDSIQSDGVDDQLHSVGDWAGAPIAQPTEHWFVGRIEATPVSGAYYYDGPATGTTRQALFDIATKPQAYAGAQFADPSIFPVSKVCVVCVVYNGASSAIYIDDMTTPVATGDASTLGVSGETIFGRYSTLGGDFIPMRMVAKGVFGMSDSATRIAQGSYLATKYTPGSHTAPTYRASAGQGNGASGTPTVTITPVAGDLLVVFAAVQNTDLTPTCTDDNGGTYVRIGTSPYNGSLWNFSVFVRTQPVPNATSTVVTVTTTGTPASELVVFAIKDMNRFGAAAVRQSATQSNQAGATTPAPTFAAAALSTNVTLGAVGGSAAAPSTTEPVGWTERQDASQPFGVASNIEVEAVSRDSGFTGTTVTWGAGMSQAYASWILELDGT